MLNPPHPPPPVPCTVEVKDGLINADVAIESSNQHHSSIVPGHVLTELAPPSPPPPQGLHFPQWNTYSKQYSQGLIQGGGVDRVASHPPSLVLLCNIVLETSTIINQPPPLHQYSLLWVATPSATFHAKFLDQRLIL